MVTVNGKIKLHMDFQFQLCHIKDSKVVTLVLTTRKKEENQNELKGNDILDLSEN